ncbi:hypothetical protein EXIGLDRAFT_717846 [Exidia glandulosa HHB12029]|uniref:Uncharacterized protein n=1 Tax=Exidia glandulosa HHB12029 TaxID=1314781 RepID=A0A165I4F4_EXIGL|nr:hypothetical protein EXIGLDRAFT_717846 [Exidia glandulosa HHB12029]
MKPTLVFALVLTFLAAAEALPMVPKDADADGPGNCTCCSCWPIIIPRAVKDST